MLAQRGREARLDELVVTRVDRGVTVATRDGELAIDLVEHLFAAIGGLGLAEGLRISTDDDELPLLDGGARAFTDALVALSIPAFSRLFRITEAATITRGESVYRFEPGPSPMLEVDVEFRSPVHADSARWDGGAESFSRDIAWARTFGWRDEAEALFAKGRARGLDPASVIVFDDDGVLEGTRPPEPHEIAKHKLLDLIGDLTIAGGVPRGTLRATRPGHAATHEVIDGARRRGLIAL